MNKIDLIIENIEYAKLVTEQAHKDELLDEALAVARELRELRPVATRNGFSGVIEVEWGESVPIGTKLYALGGEK